MRPIDADALLDTLPIVKGDRQTSLIGVLSDIVLLVCDQLTIDAVEVVRCKDCRHLLKDNSGRKAHLCVRERIPVQTSLEDYCSYAESKR